MQCCWTRSYFLWKQSMNQERQWAKWLQECLCSFLLQRKTAGWTHFKHMQSAGCLPVSRRRNGIDDPRVTQLQHTQSLSAVRARGCWIQDQSQASSASQASLGFCSNDCLILRSFKHVKTVDSRTAHLFNDHLNYTTGIYHKYKGKGELLGNQTWKISSPSNKCALCSGNWAPQV